MKKISSSAMRRLYQKYCILLIDLWLRLTKNAI